MRHVELQVDRRGSSSTPNRVAHKRPTGVCEHGTASATDLNTVHRFGGAQGRAIICGQKISQL